MPIYEFICEHCELRFEELVRNGDKPRCPECSTNDIRRMLSSFAVHSTSANLGGGGEQELRFVWELILWHLPLTTRS